MATGIVTDSTAYLPPGAADALGIRVVPVQVVVDGESMPEPAVSTADLTAALRDGKAVTTSRPSAGEFEQVYESLRADGCDAIVSVHLSSEISGTYESALIAAGRVGFPVHVVDSRQVGLAFGYPVLRAAQQAIDGAAADSIADNARRECESGLIAFSVATLEFLQRGGRINGVQARIGGALQVKPILQMRDGAVQSRELVRTSGKAVAKLVEIARAHATGPCDFAVHHVADEVRAYGLAAALGPAVGHDVAVTECGAVVAAHVGPGALAVVVSPRY